MTAHDLIDGKPAHPNRWNRWVTWEPFCNGLGKVAKKHAGRSQRIESARAVLLVQCDITARHSTTYVLRYALPEIAVQRFAPTAKLPAIPCRIKRDNAKHHCLLRPLRSVCADAQKLAKKVKSGKGFDLEDFKAQIGQMRKMGGMQELIDKLPSELARATQGTHVDDRAIRRLEGIINAMTPAERAKPEILKASRKRRIAAGAGASVGVGWLRAAGRSGGAAGAWAGVAAAWVGMRSRCMCAMRVRYMWTQTTMVRATIATAGQ